jgi:iron(III) transport system substrate-binding protein
VKIFSHLFVFAFGLVSVLSAAHAQEVTVYSARHYTTDKALYAGFTRQTGIRINHLEAHEDDLMELVRFQGASSPVDIVITVDVARLAKADELGLFMPLRSKLLEDRVPANLRSDDWIAFSVRARVIVINKNAVRADEVQTYEDLANPSLKGKVCSRSGAHPYSLSLMAALIAHIGESKAEDWARGVVANFARQPKGGDADQIKAVATGECGVAIANTHYLARLMRSKKAEDKNMMKHVRVVWPNQKTFGTHINISGGGILKSAPNKSNALRFLEYLVSDQAQRSFADGNNEWPVVPTVFVKNPALDAMGKFKADSLPLATLAKNTAAAKRIYELVGWQ